MEFISGIFVGYLLNMYGLIGMFLLSSILIHNDNRFFASVFSALFLFSVYVYCGLTVDNLILLAIGYLVIGFAWSFWRYKKFVRNGVAHYNKMNKDERPWHQTKLEAITKELSVKNNVDSIVFWVILFPFSMFESLAGDIYDVVSKTITVKLRAFYDYIMNSELKNLEFKEETEL